jgi:copper(I)-binding protein
MTIPALGQEYSAGMVKITQPWTREVPPSSKVAGRYMTITNMGSEPDTLLGGSLVGADGCEVHEMEAVGGQMKMREHKPGLVINPGETIVLKSGASHAMFLDLRVGQVMKGALIFAKAGKVDAEYKVEPLGARAPADRGPVSKSDT